ncbi:mechanosensitive ion channel family protein [Sedimenticola thiotaurini]|uniref:Small-conductance mechanosensitive channel n=1 Tax=Sedimenticola thiotaurini TaxID=1543721 RepID=A0A0F7JWW4_9GAMM|nr:mechanosensitive ion channel domain-containing protein [Sedimenticola thiotaurini]AKH19869.1 mechanosensitive ion channel protein MscS [Sedimenticola thiotaurini]
MPEFMDIEKLVSTFVIPWSINIVLALATFFIGRWVASILLKIVRKLLNKSKMDAILINFVTSILHAILLLFIVIAAMDQLGVDTTSLIALLGAAGLAVGLAMQNSLQNFAAGVMLIIFRPFKTGDFVEAGGTAGVVETISIFSTIMRTGDNREVIVPNGSIYNGTITNFSARETRRIDMVFGIGYGDDIRKAKQLLNDILEADERVLKDPAPLVAVGELADSSVNFNVRPWVKSADYWNVKFDLTERIKLAFDDNGISIPYPQMDVHLDKAE